MKKERIKRLFFGFKRFAVSLFSAILHGRTEEFFKQIVPIKWREREGGREGEGEKCENKDLFSVKKFRTSLSRKQQFVLFNNNNPSKMLRRNS